METATRQMSFLLAGPERRVLRWIAARLPRRWMPDHLTAIGVAGAVTIGAGYALSIRHPAWLWLATLGLAINWFGDSLDGTLARVRQIERPKYGYYIDHMVDAFNTTVIGAGIGFSPYVAMPLALLLVILYLCLSINVYLESSVHGQFDLGYGIVGPTEVRILLALLTRLFVAAAWVTPATRRSPRRERRGHRGLPGAGLRAGRAVPDQPHPAEPIGAAAAPLMPGRILRTWSPGGPDAAFVLTHHRHHHPAPRLHARHRLRR
jgi:phosphatidylglycerophosphate synthase